MFLTLVDMLSLKFQNGARVETALRVVPMTSPPHVDHSKGHAARMNLLGYPHIWSSTGLSME